MMPPLPPTIDIGALARYLDGTASPEDRADIEAWIGSDPARRAAVTTLQTAGGADAQRLAAPYHVQGALWRFETRLGGRKRTEAVDRPGAGRIARRGDGRGAGRAAA